MRQHDKVENYDDRKCLLGEGALWHPLRKQLFWFDILGRRLLSQMDGQPMEWNFSEYVSAAGWVSHRELVIASQTSLFLFDVEDGVRSDLVALEADVPQNRSNDGRADPFGGFWISTMSTQAAPGQGAIYRYYQGKLHRLHAGLTIPNAICFSTDGRFAYFTDTMKQIINRQRLDGEGWPVGDFEDFIDLREENHFPDGAVVDAEGFLWNAQWGSSRVARYSPDGDYVGEILFPASQISCPAFGGDTQNLLFVTSAAEGLEGGDAQQGRTFLTRTEAKGTPEPRVALGSGPIN